MRAAARPGRKVNLEMDVLVKAARTGRTAEALSGLASAGGAQPAAAPWEADPQAGDLPPAVARQVAQWDAAIVALLARTAQPGDSAAVVRVPNVLSASATMALAEDPALRVYFAKGDFMGLSGYYTSGVIEGAYHYGIFDDAE